MGFLLDPTKYLLSEMGVETEEDVLLVQAVWYYNIAMSEERS